MSTQRTDIVLDLEGIDIASESVAEFLAKSKLERRSQLSARLTVENALVRLRDNFGDGYPAQLVVSNRFGKPQLSVKVQGPRFDPREQGDETDWERALMQSAGLVPSFAYHGGYNIITISCPRPPMGSTLQAFIAIMLGLVLSQAGLRLPQAARDYILTGLIDPLFDIYVKMLAGVAGPMVFLSVACGICGIGDMAALGRNGKAIIGGEMLVNLFAGVGALAVSVPVFRLAIGTSTVGESALYSITSLFLGLIPTNFIGPLVENNMLQIVVLSVAMGIASLTLGDRTDRVRKALNELNGLIQFLMEQLCRLLPMFIVVMMISQTWSGTMGALLESWIPIVFSVGIMGLFLLVQILVACMRCKVPAIRLIRVLSPALIISCITASASAAFGTMLSICEDDLGVNEEQSSFGVPLGMVLCKPMTTILLVVVMMYSTHAYGVSANVLWYVRLGVSCLLYAIAVPPVPGGMLACYGILLSSLGIPMDALAVVTALDLLLDNLCASGNVGSVILEILVAADSLGALDHDRLQKG